MAIDCFELVDIDNGYSPLSIFIPYVSVVYSSRVNIGFARPLFDSYGTPAETSCERQEDPWFVNSTITRFG